MLKNNVLHGFLWDDLFEGKLPISLQLRGNKLLTFPKGPSFKETLLLCFAENVSFMCIWKCNDWMEKFELFVSSENNKSWVYSKCMNC